MLKFFNKYKKSKITVVLIIVFLLWVAYLIDRDVIYFHTGNKESKDYTPQFKWNNTFELVFEKEAYLYYKTAEKFEVGDDIGHKFIIASTGNYNVEEKTTDPEFFRLLDNKIDYVFNGYVVYEFALFNADCFAIYKNGTLQNSTLVYRKYGTFELLPAPRDAYMCNKFDFESLEL